MPRKPVTSPIAVVLSMFVLQGCMTVLGKKTQAVSVTSRPAGARVLVDGTDIGQAPVGLKMAKSPPHVIRFEKEGYRPVEIRLKKRKSWPFIVLPNLLWAPPILLATVNVDAQTESQEFRNTAGLVLAVAVPLAAMIIDGSSPKSTRLEPGHVSITMEKDGGGGRPTVIEMDDARFRSLVWISLRLDNP